MKKYQICKYVEEINNSTLEYLATHNSFEYFIYEIHSAVSDENMKHGEKAILNEFDTREEAFEEIRNYKNSISNSLNSGKGSYRLVEEFTVEEVDFDEDEDGDRNYNDTFLEGYAEYDYTAEDFYNECNEEEDEDYDY